MSMVSLPQDTSGRQTSRVCCGSFSRAGCIASPPSGEAVLRPEAVLPRFDFSSSRCRCRGIHSSRSDAEATAGSGSLCSRFYKEGPCSKPYFEIWRVHRQAEAMSGGWWAAPPFKLRGRPGGGPCVSSGGGSSRSSPAPDWLTFQCHSRRHCWLLLLMETGEAPPQPVNLLAARGSFGGSQEPPLPLLPQGDWTAPFLLDWALTLCVPES